MRTTMRTRSNTSARLTVAPEFGSTTIVSTRAHRQVCPGLTFRGSELVSVERARHLFVALDASANLCTAQTRAPPGQPLPTTPPVGLKPCPDLETRAGVWRFDANKAKQRFPA